MKIIYMILISTIFIYSEEYAVITNQKSTITSLTKRELKSIYLRKKRYYGKIKLMPLNLSLENSIRKSFQADILQMNFTQLETYWMKQHYKGHRPPYQVKSTKGAILFVKKKIGAIAYIPYRYVDSSVKVIYRGGKP